MQTRTTAGIGMDARGRSPKARMVDRFAAAEGRRPTWESLVERLRGEDGKLRDARGVVIAPGSERGKLAALDALLGG